MHAPPLGLCLMFGGLAFLALGLLTGDRAVALSGAAVCVGGAVAVFLP